MPATAASESPPPHREVRRIELQSLKFIALQALLWCALSSIYYGLPYLQPGVRIIVGAKMRDVERNFQFDPVARERLVMLGDSRVLAGFVPKEFDALSGGETSSYNLGFPMGTPFGTGLQALLDRGQVPTTILIAAVDWGSTTETAPPSIFRPIPSDDEVMQRLFPFRTLPYDVSLFLVESGRWGGPRAFYDYGRASAERVVANRGYYFISGQSRYPNDRLPDDMRYATDTPEQPLRRDLQPEGAHFKRFYETLERHDMRAIIVPIYVREYAYAPPPQQHDLPFDAFPRITISEPLYLRYPNRYFSDPVHLNPESAATYTQFIHDLMASRRR